MDVNIISTGDNSVELSFKGIDIAYANILRRTMISEVPTCAIERTVVNENTSYMNNEPLSARLSLVPLRYIGTEASAKLNINVTCTEDEMPVYSGNITTDADTYIDNKKILIMKLKKGQSIDVDMYTKVDCGKTHSKFSPVTVVDLLDRGTDIYMNIESVGQMVPLDILNSAVLILQQKNDDILSKLGAIKPDMNF